MRHRKHTFKIGRTGAHRKALLANQVCSLITEGEIKTTITKAKETRRLADKMVTLGKKGIAAKEIKDTLHQRRQALSKLRDETAVAQLFAEIAPKFANRDGGYTRIIRIGSRVGDAAEMCILQWVEEENQPKPSKKKAKAENKEEPKKEAKTEKVEEKDDVAEKPVDSDAGADQKAEEKETEAKEEAAPEKAEEKEEPSPASEAGADKKAETKEEEKKKEK